MSADPPSLLEKVDVFGLLGSGTAGPSPSTHTEAEGNQHLSEQQYTTLVHMVAASLGLSTDAAERLFSCYRVEDGAGHAASASPPPLCAHLSREGVEAYWASVSATNNIPDVRCCDARDVDKQEPFPATGYGPHVHCLYCFHSAIDAAVPAGRGVPPPVVADFRDAATLQAHQQTHHDRYRTYLRLLDDCSSAAGADMLSDEGRAACETAAEQEGRHGCYMAALGTAACPVTTYYCADCDAFAPLARFTAGDAATSNTWASTEEVNVVLSRLLLSCHLLYMMNGSHFTSTGRVDADGAESKQHTHALHHRHFVFLFRPILFHDSVAEEVIEQFEEGAECTHAAVVLPDASVRGSPAELLLLRKDESETSSITGTTTAASGAAAASAAATYAPAVIGFAMEWATADAVQAKLQLLQEQHSTGISASTDAVLPFQVERRWVYIEDTEEWVLAHVPFHRSVAQRSDLPSAYDDVGDEGIRVVATYHIDAPMPSHAVAEVDEDSADEVGEMSDGKAAEEVAEDPLALDGCPYSMETRTVDFFARMTALAKAMHELAAWRSSIDENKTNIL